MERISEEMNETRKKRRFAPVGIIVGVVVAALAAGYLACCAVVDQDTVLGHAMVNGVDLSGMTYDQALEAVETAAQTEYEGVVLTVEAEGETYQVDLDGALTLDAEATADQAFAAGHGSFLTRGAALLQSLTGTRTYDVQPTVADQELLREAIDHSGLLSVDTGTATTYEIQEDTILLTKGTVGQVADVTALVDLVLDAVARDDFTTVLDCPMTEGSLDEADLEAIYEAVYVEAENATLDPEQDYAIVDSVTGVSFDLDEAEEALASAGEGDTVEVALVYTEPDITTELMEENLFRDVLGTYSSTATGATNRKTNVKLSAESCNEVILLPGETFSYNDTVGERTEAAGYKTAAAYSNGDTVQELGGGICQTSSTLYNAVLLANLEITERTNHSYASSYVPLGQDATVSWGGPDFKFTNDTEYPIKIATSYSTGNILTCSIYGTNLTGNTVKVTNEVLSTTNYSVKKVEDDSMYEGETSVQVEGETGYKVQTYRSIYDAEGNLLSTTEEAYSVYRKRDEVLLVGTKEKKTSSESNNSGSSNKKNNSSSNNNNSNSNNSGSSNSGSNNSSSDNSGSSDNSSGSSGSSGSSSDSGSSGSSGNSSGSGDSGSSDNSSNSNSSGNSDNSSNSNSSGGSDNSSNSNSSGDSGSANADSATEDGAQE
ncbi:MAG: VanW family protein [Clostridiales bacterium]|nr:VanW family protein [Clostridiales bacterium]